MKPLSCLSFSLCLCLFVRLCLPLHASDLAAHRVGDVAEADIITPVALDVVDSAATAALQSARATQYPAVFRSLPAMTNAVAREFLSAFAEAQTNFLADLAAEFHVPQVNEATIASADFGGLVTAFGVKNKRFPVTDELAAEWARGGDGQAIREKLLASLLQAASRRVRPDALPKGMIVGETVRLAPVADEHQKLSFEAVQAGQLVPAASLTTISNAQASYRREFPVGQQLLARALAGLLKPNCLPDAPFTELTRGTAVCQLIVSDHFDAGDAIIRRGGTMDAKTLAALAALHEKLASGIPGPPSPPVAVAVPQPNPLPPPAPTTTPARLPASVPAKPQPLPARSRLSAGLRHQGLILSLASVSAIALLVAGWQWLRFNPQASPQTRKTSNPQPATPNLQPVPQSEPPERSTLDVPLGSVVECEKLSGAFSTCNPQPQPATQAPLPLPGGIPSSLSPQVTQVVREAVQQELGSQRRELLLAQLAATDKISVLVQRLDDLHVPMEARLHTYEMRIQLLERELAISNAENRELLKMKIEMVSRQLAAERAATSAPLAAAEF